MNNDEALTSEVPFRTGIYRHYKGNLYEVIDLVKHSETMEELVLYKPLYGKESLWVRPKEMFFESIEKDGKKIPRFEFVENK